MTEELDYSSRCCPKRLIGTIHVVLRHFTFYSLFTPFPHLADVYSFPHVMFTHNLFMLTGDFWTAECDFCVTYRICLFVCVCDSSILHNWH